MRKQPLFGRKTGKHVAHLFGNGGRHSNTTVVYVSKNLCFEQTLEQTLN